MIAARFLDIGDTGEFRNVGADESCMQLVDEEKKAGFVVRSRMKLCVVRGTQRKDKEGGQVGFDGGSCRVVGFSEVDCKMEVEVEKV